MSVVAAGRVIDQIAGQECSGQLQSVQHCSSAALQLCMSTLMDCTSPCPGHSAKLHLLIVVAWLFSSSPAPTCLMTRTFWHYINVFVQSTEYLYYLAHDTMSMYSLQQQVLLQVYQTCYICSEQFITFRKYRSCMKRCHVATHAGTEDGETVGSSLCRYVDSVDM